MLLKLKILLNTWVLVVLEQCTSGANMVPSKDNCKIEDLIKKTEVF